MYYRNHQWQYVCDIAKCKCKMQNSAVISIARKRKMSTLWRMRHLSTFLDRTAVIFFGHSQWSIYQAVVNSRQFLYCCIKKICFKINMPSKLTFSDHWVIYSEFGGIGQRCLIVLFSCRWGGGKCDKLFSCLWYFAPSLGPGHRFTKGCKS